MSATPRQRGAPIRSISAILPAHNQAASLTQVVEGALDTLIDVVPSFEVIIVDDGSTDATRRIAEELAASHAQVRLVRLPQRRGYGAAWREGLAAATKQYVFVVDPDRRYAPAELDRLVKWDDLYDIVAGFRLKRSDPFGRRVMALLFRLVVRMAFGLNFRDVNCGFKLMRASLLKSLDLHCDGKAIHTEVLVRASEKGASVREVGVHQFPRPTDETFGYRLGVALKAAAELRRLRATIRQERRLAAQALQARQATSRGPQVTELQSPRPALDTPAGSPEAPIAHDAAESVQNGQLEAPTENGERAAAVHEPDRADTNSDEANHIHDSAPENLETSSDSTASEANVQIDGGAPRTAPKEDAGLVATQNTDQGSPDEGRNPANVPTGPTTDAGGDDTHPPAPDPESLVD